MLVHNTIVQQSTWNIFCSRLPYASVNDCTIFVLICFSFFTVPSHSNIIMNGISLHFNIERADYIFSRASMIAAIQIFCLFSVYKTEIKRMREMKNKVNNRMNTQVTFDFITFFSPPFIFNHKKSYQNFRNVTLSALRAHDCQCSQYTNDFVYNRRVRNDGSYKWTLISVFFFNRTIKF